MSSSRWPSSAHGETVAVEAGEPPSSTLPRFNQRRRPEERTRVCRRGPNRRPARPTSSRRCDPYPGADRAAHTGAAKTAIAGRVFCKVLLMIVLGKVELRGGQNLGRN